MRWRLGCLIFAVLAFGATLTAQIQPIPNLSVQPIPIRGGDLVPGYGIANAFVPGPPGQSPPFDPIGADPHSDLAVLRISEYLQQHYEQPQSFVLFDEFVPKVHDDETTGNDQIT